MDSNKSARIEQQGKVWWVVVTQERGNPMRFECETERIARQFAQVFAQKGQGPRR